MSLGRKIVLFACVAGMFLTPVVWNCRFDDGLYVEHYKNSDWALTGIAFLSLIMAIGGATAKQRTRE